MLPVQFSLGHRLNWNLKELDGYATLHTARIHCVESLVTSPHRVLRLEERHANALARLLRRVTSTRADHAWPARDRICKPEVAGWSRVTPVSEP